MRCYGNKPNSFMQINPSGGIPVAIIKGKIITESNDIMNVLEQTFKTNPMYPINTIKLTRVNSLLQLERRVFSCWFNWLTSNNPDSTQMDELLQQVDSQLSIDSSGPYFLGEFSMIDIMFTPFLERMAASLPYYKGFESRTFKYPYLLKWYEAMDTRLTYSGLKSDYVSSLISDFL